MPLKKGARVRLVRTTDTATELTPGELGSVTGTDSIGTVHVRWDSGSSLGMSEEDGDILEEAEE